MKRDGRKFLWVVFGGYCVALFLVLFVRFGAIMLILLGVLLSVETIQVLTLRGSFDVDDIILNMSGAVIGFFLSGRRVVC